MVACPPKLSGEAAQLLGWLTEVPLRVLGHLTEELHLPNWNPAAVFLKHQIGSSICLKPCFGSLWTCRIKCNFLGRDPYGPLMRPGPASTLSLISCQSTNIHTPVPLLHTLFSALKFLSVSIWQNFFGFKAQECHSSCRTNPSPFFP